MMARGCKQADHGGDIMADAMRALKAHVKGGRLLLDEPTDLPEGAEVELTLVEGELSAEERARLDAALDEGMAAARRGDVVDADVVIREMLDRR
jgi:hypothetical protein